MLNYKKLMEAEPSVLGEMINSLNQKIEFVEHPFFGDDYPVIAICRELELASDTDFWDLDDMLAEHKEYEPSFVNGKLLIGEFEA